jgi:HTH-type transcriptional regulator/antitoxin MqsA
MSDKNVCPICEVGQLSPSVFSRFVPHRGQEIPVVGLAAWQCDQCGERTYDPAQIRRNQVTIVEARKKFSDAKRRERGLLSSDEIRAYRELLNLKQSEAAIIFGGGVNCFSKYERGEVIQSEALDISLRGAVQCPSYFAWLLSRAGLSARATGRDADTYDQSWAEQETAPIAELLVLRPARFEETQQLVSRDWTPQSVAEGYGR